MSLQEVQKGCRKRSRRTHNDLLYIERAVNREAKSWKNNLAVA